jgi:hypothetical protein
VAEREARGRAKCDLGSGLRIFLADGHHESNLANQAKATQNVKWGKQYAKQ